MYTKTTWLKTRKTPKECMVWTTDAETLKNSPYTGIYVETHEASMYYVRSAGSMCSWAAPISNSLWFGALVWK